MIFSCKEREKRKANLKKFRERDEEYRNANSERINNQRRERYKKNPKNVLESSRKYYQKNKNKVHSKFNEYSKKRKKIDPVYRFRRNISTLVYINLKRRLSSKKGKGTFTFLPYTVDALIQHLENLFKVGMTWENYGHWHIDHIRPDCSFNYKSVEDEEFQKCWALSNLQPLWAEENLRKGGKWEQ